MNNLVNTVIITGPASNVSVTFSNNYYILDANSGNITLILPNIPANGVNFAFARIDNNPSTTVTLQILPGNVINGNLTSYDIGPSAYTNVVSRGVSWYVTGASDYEASTGRSGMATFGVTGTAGYQALNLGLFGTTVLYLNTAGATRPHFVDATTISPIGQTGVLSIVPGATAGQPDMLVCTKKILSLKYYAQVNWASVIGINTGGSLNAILNVTGFTGPYQGIKSGSAIFGIAVLGINVGPTSAQITAEWTNIPPNLPFTIGLAVPSSLLGLSTGIIDTGSYGTITYEL
jgi:hypothetical protein